MIGHIETFEDVQKLTYVMDTVGYKVIFKAGKGYVLENRAGSEVTTGHTKYLDFLAECKKLYDEEKAKEVDM